MTSSSSTSTVEKQIEETNVRIVKVAACRRYAISHRDPLAAHHPRDYNDAHPELFTPFQVLLAFGYLIVGFALSFAVLFHGNDQFRDLWRAVVRTVVMMMGEYEYEELFSRTENGRMSFLPVTSRIVFFVFTMLASIVLINLMIGLAVNDIQGLEKEVQIEFRDRNFSLFLFYTLLRTNNT